MLKKYLLKILSFFSFFWKIIPEKIRMQFLFLIFVLESRGDERKALKQLFSIKDKLNLVINERSLSFGNGIHPKHYLTNYHEFFIKNIKNGENVLDIGCGYGAVAFTVAKKRDKSKIVGVDYDDNKLYQASKNNLCKNLKFENLDATKSIPKGKWDIIILSNVLEHINNRILFLKKIINNSKCRKILIRVPLFERNWEIAFRKELDTYYFSDNDHKIEHTVKEFYEEMNSSGLIIKDLKTIWGEIWAVCIVK